MIGLALSAFAFAFTFIVSRRSATRGLFAVLGTGYFYGILRANFPSSLTYFAFDAAVIAYYLTFPWNRLGGTEAAARSRQLLVWTFLLMGWPVILLLVPVQDPVVQLVGLRTHVLLLPFMLIGARFSRLDLDALVLFLCWMNIIAFAFALAELVVGVPAFYPRNPVTELIYRSTDASGGLIGALRVPAIFANASSYGATMTITLPLLIGAWVQKPRAKWHKVLFTLGIFASMIGAFLAASRVHILIMMMIIIVTLVSGRIGTAARAAWGILIVGAGWIVMNNERLVYRLTTLSLESILERFAGSVNRNLMDVIFRYPLGNGLGGGGTNMPGFLQGQVRHAVAIENQYAMYVLEQGLPGFLLWLAFIAWVLTRPGGAGVADRWNLGHRLIWWASGAYFASGLIGTGLLTSVPFSCLFLFGVGWLAGHAYDRIRYVDGEPGGAIPGALAASG